MTIYVPPAIITDPRTIADNGKSFLENELPGWRRTGSNPLDILFDYFALVAGEQAEVVGAELTSAYRSLGQLFGVPPLEETYATALATFTVKDVNGPYLIPAGTTVALRNANSELEGFQLNGALTVPNGSTTGTAVVEALVPGEGANNLGGASELVIAPEYLVSVSLATSGGGGPAESDEAFLDRLTEDLQTIPPGAVNGQSAAALARTIPGIARATAVNLLKPKASDGGEGASEVTNEEAAVTVAATKSDGSAATAEALAAAKAKLEAGAITNLRFFVVAPHYEKIDVTATVAAWPGASEAAVKAAAKEAIEGQLSPATAQADSSGSLTRWANDPWVRLADLYTALGVAPGVRYVPALVLGAHGGSLTAADHQLVASSKVPALPEVGTIVVNVTPTS